VGHYWVNFYETADWSFGYPNVDVDEVDDPDDLIGGTGVVDDLISASAAFTEPAYAWGDTPHMTLSVTNDGAVAVRGLTVICYVSGGALTDAGELGREPGVLVPARSTMTFELAFELDQQGTDAGHMQVRCVVGAAPYANGSVTIVAVARIPSDQVVARVTGRLSHYGPPAALCPYIAILCPAPTLPLPGVKVYLRNQVTGLVVARSVTDANAIFRFDNVPADLYDFVVVGPWTPGTIVVRSSEIGFVDVNVYPGPEQPDPDAPSPSTGTPAPAPPLGGLTPPGLATTGADLRWLMLSGLLTLALGIGLITGTRRTGMIEPGDAAT
jgi:hypothetical protein